MSESLKSVGAITMFIDDTQRSKAFYEQVFGWQPGDAMDMGPQGKYQMFNRTHGMIGGMMNKPKEMANVPQNWQIYSSFRTCTPPRSAA